MAARPDVTAVITVDHVGDATTTISSAKGETVVDRSEAWTYLMAMATEAGRALLVRTLDEHGHVHRDLVHPDLPVKSESSPGEVAIDVRGDSLEIDGHADAVMQGDGETVDVHPPWRAHVAAPSSSSAEGHAAPPAADDGDRVATAVAESECPPAEVDPAAHGRRPGSGGGARTGDGHHRPDALAAPVMAVSAAVLLACTIVLVGTSNAGTPTHTKQQATVADDVAATGIPGNGLPNYSERPRWQVELAEGSMPAVTASGLVAIHASDGTMQLLDGATGEVRWSTEVGQDASSPRVTKLGAGDAIVWRRPGELVVARPSTGTGPAVYEIGNQDKISHAGTQILVTDPDRPGRAQILHDDGLIDVDIGDDATAMAAVDGVIISSDGHPRLRRTQVGETGTTTVGLQAPAGMVLCRWAGMAGDTVTVVWGSPGRTGPSDHMVAAVHDASTGKQLASARAVWDDVAHATLTSAHGRRPATVALGPIVLWPDRTHEPVVHSGTTWDWHVAGQVWGTRSNGERVRLDRTGTVEPLPSAKAAPIGIAQRGVAVVVIDDTVYGLGPTGEPAPSRTAGAHRRQRQSYPDGLAARSRAKP